MISIFKLKVSTAVPEYNTHLPVWSVGTARLGKSAKKAHPRRAFGGVEGDRENRRFI